MNDPEVLQAPLRPLPVYMTAIAALVTLAKRDFYGQEFPSPFTTLEYPNVRIGIEGIGKPLIERRFAIWGIYTAAYMMSLSGVFKESRFGLTYNHESVGTVTVGPSRANAPVSSGEVIANENATEVALISEASVSDTAPASIIPSANLSTSAGSFLTYTAPVAMQTSSELTQTWTLLSNNSYSSSNSPKVSIRYLFYGAAFLPNSVYFTIMDALANTDLPTFAATSSVPPSAILDEPSYNTHIVFQKFPFLAPRGPQWTYEYLFDGLQCIAQVMVAMRTFKEINATVTVDAGNGEIPVGDIHLRYGPPPGVGPSTNVATS